MDTTNMQQVLAIVNQSITDYAVTVNTTCEKEVKILSMLYGVKKTIESIIMLSEEECTCNK